MILKYFVLGLDRYSKETGTDHTERVENKRVARWAQKLLSHGFYPAPLIYSSLLAAAQEFCIIEIRRAKEGT